MTADGQYKTRPETLIAFTKLMMDETGTTVSEFSQNLIARYLELVPENQQIIDSLKLADEQETVDGYIKVKDSTRRAVDRYLNGVVQIPVLLEEPWVAALPKAYRSRCCNELIRRYGKLAIEFASELNSGVLLKAAELMKESATAMESLVPIVEDGIINDDDHPFVNKAGEKLTNLLELTAGMLNLLYSKFPEEFPCYLFKAIVDEDDKLY